jgi:hypothetical protein
MISEKTVELNLTIELVNSIYYRTKVRPYIIAPSQREEGVFGYDARIGFPASLNLVLIQYKRAYVIEQINELVYYLNRTANQDQHLRLLFLELNGWNVYYALPLFYEEDEVIRYRRRLLYRTYWIKPSLLMPFGILTGHHEIRINQLTGLITVHSDQGKFLENYLDFAGFLKEVIPENESISFKERKKNNCEEFFSDFNAIFNNEVDIEFNDLVVKPSIKDDIRLISGQSTILF